MPKLSDTMTVATVVKWLKSVGDPITKGEPYADVETDKATTPLICPIEGKLVEILAVQGAEVPIGGPVAKISSNEAPNQEEQEQEEEPPPLPLETEEGASDASITEDVPEPNDVEVVDDETPEPASESSMEEEDAPEDQSISDALPTEFAVPEDSDSVQESGSAVIDEVNEVFDDQFGVQEKKDDESDNGDQSAESTVNEEKEFKKDSFREKKDFDSIKLNSESSEVNQLVIEKEIDATNLVLSKKAINEHFQKIDDGNNENVIGLNDIIVCAVCKAIERVPEINTTIKGKKVEMHDSVNLSFSVYLETGTVNPVIEGASTKDLLSIASESRELINRARDELWDPTDYAAPTFCIANLATHGIDYFKAPLQPPAAACLAVASTTEKPVVDETGRVTVGQCLRLTLTCDQRAVQVPIAVTFIKNLGDILENPAVATL